MNEFKQPPIDVSEELKKAIGFLNDGTYDRPELFESHILQIINDSSNDGARHKEQLERMIFKYQELRAHQKEYFKAPNKQMPHVKTILRECKEMEKDLDNKSIGLLSLGYNIDRFKTNKPSQGSLI